MNNAEQIVKQATAAQAPAMHPKNSVWVSASAGTGKTHVLTSRILRLLVTNFSLKPSDILAVTYTKASAREMENRILERLGEWAGMSDDKLSLSLTELLKQQPATAQMNRAKSLFSIALDEPAGLNISTVHGFCQYVLAKFPLEAGVAPGFKIIEDVEQKEMLKNAQNRVFLNAEEDSEGWEFNYYASTLSETTMRDVFNQFVQKSGEFRKLFAASEGVEGVLFNLSEALNVDMEVTPATKNKIIASLMQLSLSQKNDLKQTIAALQQGGIKAKERADIISEFIILDNSEDIVKNWPNYRKAFLTVKLDKLKNLVDQKVIATGGESIAEILNNEQQRVENVEIAISNIESYLITKSYLVIGQKILQTYENLKRSKGVLDFDDLIEKVATLITKKEVAEWIKYRMDRTISHVLVDEAQDTDTEQWSILNSLVEEFYAGKGQTEVEDRTFFAVGDTKQSIYRFRGTTPHTFADMRKFLQSKEKDGHSVAFVGLDTSFRSSPAVLNFVDSVFSDKSRLKAIDGLIDELNHYTAKVGNSGRVEVWAPIDEGAKEKVEKEIWPLPQVKEKIVSSNSLIAKKVAESIKGLLESKEPLASTGKAPSAGDIMILLRSRSIVGSIITELDNYGLKHTGTDDFDLRDDPIIDDLVALGCFLSNIDDDLSLLQTLRSPLFGFNNKNIEAILNAKKGGTIWQTIYSLNAEPFVSVKNILQNLLQKVDVLPVFDLYNNALQITNARGKMLHRFGAGTGDASLKVVNEPIDAFLDAILSFERKNFGLTTFLHEFKTTGVRLKKELASAKNSIRILTVHSSKGLEAPIVYLPDAGRNYFSGLGKENLLWSENNNKEKTLFVHKLASHKKATPLQIQLQEEEKERNFEDEMRLLYVALTRAKEQIYVASKKELKESDDKNSWYAQIIDAIKNDENFDKQPDGSLVLYHPNANPIKEQSTEEHFEITEETSLPIWAQTAAKEEFGTSIKQASDSLKMKEMASLLENPDKKILFQKGKIMHKLLQILPEIEEESRAERAQKWLSSNFTDIKKEEQLQLVESALTVFKSYAHIFVKNSRAEVPLAACVKGKMLEGVIDRLIINDDKKEVLIVDYKTNKVVPKIVPKEYMNQLEIYKQIAENIFTEYTVKTAIIWTSNTPPRLENVHN